MADTEEAPPVEEAAPPPPEEPPAEAPPAEAPDAPAEAAPTEAAPTEASPDSEAPPGGEDAPPKKTDSATDIAGEKKTEEGGATAADALAAKKKRRASMFDEAANAQELMGQGGDITSTLQAFFKEASTSADKLPTQKRLRRPKLVFENTYRLDSKKPFVVSRAESIIEKTLEELLTGVHYNIKTSSALCGQIAEKIRNRLLVFDYDRYKLIVHVGLGPMNRQGFVMAFKHLGDPIRDFYAQGNFSNYTLFAVVSAHAVYFD